MSAGPYGRNVPSSASVVDLQAFALAAGPPMAVVLVAVAVGILRPRRFAPVAWSGFALAAGLFAWWLHAAPSFGRLYPTRGEVLPFTDAAFVLGLGLDLGILGVVVNAVAATVIGLRRARRPRERTRTVAATSALLAASALLVVVVPLRAGAGVTGPILPVTLAATALVGLLVHVVVRARDDDASLLVVVPVVVALLVVATAGGTGRSGIDPLLLSSPEPTPPHETQRPAPGEVAAPAPGAPGNPQPATATSLESTRVRTGLGALASRTAGVAEARGALGSTLFTGGGEKPAVDDAEACESTAGPGSRWIVTVSVEPVDPSAALAAILSTWERAGYRTSDRALGADLRSPSRTDLPAARLSVRGGDGRVTARLESFCVRS
ncbi:hypothetical protein AS850_06270 [Frondihabitans sp. 762G35]|nr:hypothetical protein AS850_06270 [Frondihabitans sp. 762G35]